MAKPRAIGAAIGRAIVRCYTFVIMAVVVWSGYTAVAYIYRSVFQPGQVPATVTDFQPVTRAEALRNTEGPGISAPAMRAPIGHYHAIDRWFQPDLRNGCITSGCHDPIPHSKSKELRAFANLHATFMTCETCHQALAGFTDGGTTQPARAPLAAVWIDMKSGAVQPPPAILQLMKHLQPASTQPAEALTEYSATAVRSLRQAIDIIGGDPALNYLATQIETSEPGSPVWRLAMNQLADELPNHARGEYGAKIAPATAGGDAQPIRQDFGGLIDEFFSRTNDQAQRSVIVKKIHQDVQAKPEGCTPCHRGSPPLLDFAALGYPPERIRALASTPIAEMMQQIRQGQPFNLPLAP